MSSKTSYGTRSHRNPCPHCGSSFRIRTSEQENALLRRLWGQCSNVNCGFTAQGFLSWDAELSPSATPNPNINLPKSTAKQHEEVACV